MIILIRRIIRGLVAPNCQISCSTKTWKEGLRELYRRGGNKRESGAFLLGKNDNGVLRILRFVYYDDLEPCCLDTGMVVMNGSGYGVLWSQCREKNMKVVSDIHTHPGLAVQSELDRKNPMIAVKGHIALIIPYYAAKYVQYSQIGIYEYDGDHKWYNHSKKDEKPFFYIGMWG